jgi:DNA-binding transcriptional ArsR family regulator
VLLHECRRPAPSEEHRPWTIGWRLDVSTGRVAGSPITDEGGIAVYDQGDEAGGPGLIERSADGIENCARRHPLRASILALLSSEKKSERTVEDLSAELPDEPSRRLVDYHLKVLRTVGLVSEQRRKGAAATYRLV